MLQSLQAFCVKKKSSSKFYNILLLQNNTGKVLLKARSFFTEDYWFWICIGALFGFSLLFNVLFIAALTFLNRKSLSLMLILGYWMAMKFQYDICVEILFQLWVTQKLSLWVTMRRRRRRRSHHLDDREQVWHYQNLFLFCCSPSFRFADLAHFTKSIMVPT